MTAAYRLKGIGWFAIVVAVALAFYLVSLRVAAERKRLDDVNGRVAAAERDIRALETEFDTRANLVQLERWNGDTLSLAAPTAGQYVRDAAQLAAIDVTAGGASVRTAALVVPSIAPTAAPSPLVAGQAPVQVAAVAPSLDPAASATVVRAVALDPAPPSLPVRALARLAGVGRAIQPVARARQVAMLDGKLLSDATLGDLIANAKREARHELGSSH